MKSPATPAPLAAQAEPVGRSRLAFLLYLLFITSWFLHLTARIPPLGAIRFDLLLLVTLIALAWKSPDGRRYESSSVDKWLIALIVFSLLEIPMVEWPGSVLRVGIEDLIKAVAFYFFTVRLVSTDRQLRTFLAVFLACQLFRIAEPVFLHLTTGYWGSLAATGGGADFLNRLSGAPKDVVNPNGLAFIICSVIPFMFLLSSTNWRWRIAMLVSLPLCLYALALTGSRSGIVALVVVVAALVAMSKHRVVMSVLGVVILVVGFLSLPADMKDRYLSLVGKSEQNAGTAAGRIEGLSRDFGVAMRRPIFGYGLGTSREANFNYGHNAQPSHNLYLETLEEIGLIGLIIFLGFLRATFKELMAARRQVSGRSLNASLDFPIAALSAVLAWAVMDFIFSFASYGLRSFDWYLIAGLTVAGSRIIAARKAAVVPGEQEKEDANRARTARWRRYGKTGRAIPGPAMRGRRV
jgi:O-antigen ligase